MLSTINIKKLYEDAIIPEKKTEEAAGMDLYAYEKEGKLIKKNEIELIKTGIAIELPKGTFADIRPRSGFSTKTKILIPNSPGTIDSDYRGEILIPLFNLSGEDFFLEHLTRIAQLIVFSYIQFEFKEVNSLSNTSRGEQGFGSTGTK